jgi:hypothetical protein
VAGVADEVGTPIQALQGRVRAVPAQHLRSAQVRADQDERVVAGQGGRVVQQLLEGPVAVRGGEERELAAGPARLGRGLLAAGVQDAADPRDAGVHREPGAAGLLVTPADQRRPGPVPGRRLPRAPGELIAETQQQQRHTGGGLETDHNGAHVRRFYV